MAGIRATSWLLRAGSTGWVHENVRHMLYEGGVCVLSGTAFGKVSPNHIRISYANSQDNLKLALQRIEEVVARTPAGATA